MVIGIYLPKCAGDVTLQEKGELFTPLDTGKLSKWRSWKFGKYVSNKMQNRWQDKGAQRYSKTSVLPRLGQIKSTGVGFGANQLKMIIL